MTTIVDASCPLHSHRGFYFHTQETASSVLDGFTISKGKSDRGGGIGSFGASATIRNCIVEDNQSTIDGGGIYVSGGSPLLEGCAIGGKGW